MAKPKQKSFRTLAQAAAYCERAGLPYDCVSEKGGRYVVKGDPNPLTVASNPRRTRKPRSKETRRETEERLDDWRMLKEDLRESRERDAAIREERKVELASVSEDCDDRRKATTEWCGDRRDETRGRARIRKGQEKELREQAHEGYATKREMTSREKQASGLRYLMSESDSIAEQGIPELLVPAWRVGRHNIPYDRQPDDRATLFMQRFGEGGLDEPLFLEEEAMRMLTPEFFARSEAESRAASEFLEEDEDEDVPF